MSIRSQTNNKQMLSSYGFGYIPAIDGLRALAVVAVIINHLDKRFLASGYLGVDVFFVISGFVITASLVNREEKRIGTF